MLTPTRAFQSTSTSFKRLILKSYGPLVKCHINAGSPGRRLTEKKMGACGCGNYTFVIVAGQSYGTVGATKLSHEQQERDTCHSGPRHCVIYNLLDCRRRRLLESPHHHLDRKREKSITRGRVCMITLTRRLICVLYVPTYCFFVMMCGSHVVCS